MRRTQRRAMATAVALAGAVAVGGAGGALAQETVLRVAMGSPGEAGIRVWNDIAAQFEAANPGVRVEMNYQEDDLYQTIGLPTLPMIAVYVAFNRHIVDGITAGSVK
jgi:raffinose/stachyose/melibiose transport system substrate-binding protein